MYGKSDKRVIKKLIRWTAVLCGAVCTVVLCTGFAVAGGIPDRVSIVEGESLDIHSPLPVTAKVGEGCIPADDISKAGVTFSDEVKLFGIVPIKSVRVSIVNQTMVVPCGCAFGVKFYTSGVMVIGMTDVDTAEGAKNPAYVAGIRIGDEIMAINGKAVCTNADVSAIVSGSGGKTLIVSLKRGDVGFSARFKPVKSQSDGEYKAGLWVRDSTAGIGTITYYNPQTLTFGGLGHGICDVSTGKIMPLMSGDVVKVNIQSILKGTKGQPGEIQGTLGDSDWGSLYSNTETGVFGTLNSIEAGKAIPVAMRQDVTAGPAYILATLDNTGVKKYAVSIESINYNEDSPTKNMIIRVTDSSLIRKTGGIVQGMSGCPIIQNGKLVGAVTHVFVNDPQKGYGIFAENMIICSKTLEKAQEKDVS
jgi:stage IV sporulation protein B